VDIDEMLRADSLTYTDLARMAKDEATAEGASLLKAVFGSTDTTAIVTESIAEPKNDGDLETKGALGELRAAVLARLGLTLPDDAGVATMRLIIARYILANELRSDLGLPQAEREGPVASALKNVTAPASADHQKTLREISKRLRERHAAAYVVLADRIVDVGLVAAAACATIAKSNGNPTTWVERYVSPRRRWLVSS
jgi:hypothetical protein